LVAYAILGLAFPILSRPIVWCDNIRALALAFNPEFHACTKHIEVDVHFIWEKVANDVCLKFISTVDQVVDIFTKGLSSVRFNFLKNKLMLCLPPISLGGGGGGGVNQPAHKDQEGNITTDTPKPLREISCTKMERIATSSCI
jgi:hypothetical protein